MNQKVLHRGDVARLTKALLMNGWKGLVVVLKDQRGPWDQPMDIAPFRGPIPILTPEPSQNDPVSACCMRSELAVTRKGKA